MLRHKHPSWRGNGYIISFVLHGIMAGLIFIPFNRSTVQQLPPPVVVTLAPIGPLSQSPHPSPNPGRVLDKPSANEKPTPSLARPSPAVKPEPESSPPTLPKALPKEAEKKPVTKPPKPSAAPDPLASMAQDAEDLLHSIQQESKVKPKPKKVPDSAPPKKVSIDDKVQSHAKKDVEISQKDTPKKDSSALSPSKGASKKTLDQVLGHLTEDTLDATSKDTLEQDKERTAGDGGIGGMLGSETIMGNMDAIRQHIARHWRLPAGLQDEAAQIVVELTIELSPQGYVQNARLTSSGSTSHPLYRTVAESALRAVQSPEAQPFPLPQGPYKEWKRMTLKFQAKDLKS